MSNELEALNRLVNSALGTWYDPVATVHDELVFKDKSIVEYAIKRNEPMKPLNGDMCPNCKKPLFGEEDNFCNKCGQAIDWNKE
jgi:hypothetical protein